MEFALNRCNQAADDSYVHLLRGGSFLSMVILVGLGSAAGGVARFLLSVLFQQRAGAGFPTGTLFINISGSLLLGFVVTYALATPAVSPEVRAMLTSGFCGGFTTFSTFTYETMMLLESGQFARASFYVVLSVVVSLLGAWLGITFAREFLALRVRV